MRVAVDIILDEKEKRELRRLAASRSSAIRVAERARIVLLASEGLNNLSIAEEIGIDRNKVGRWRRRYAEDGLTGLRKERPRGGNHGGKDSAEQAELRRRIIEATTQSLPLNATHWSTRSLAQALGTTHSLVHRVWQENGLKPHLIKSFKVSNDPKFEEKLHDVVGLYMDPPNHAVVFSFDEKSSIQALDRTQPGLPMKKGRGETMTHDYKRHGTTTLFAAMEMSSGRVIADVYRRHRHEEFLAFLKKVEKSVPKDQEIHIILDNYATHKHPNVLKWLERKKRVFLHFTPTSSSWVNLVERFFANLTEQRLRRSAFTSVKELEAMLREYVDRHNEFPTPITWTKSAEEIIKKVQRARQRLDNL